MTKPELKHLKTIKEEQKAEEKPVEEHYGERRLVGFFEMFRFADAKDKVFIFLAVLCTMVSGLGFPLASVILGESIQVYGNAITVNMVLNDIPEFIYYNNWTRVEILQNPLILRDRCADADLFYGKNNTCLGAELEEPLTDALRKWVYYFVLIGICVFVASVGQVTFWTISAERQGNRMRGKFLSNVLHQDIGWFDTHEAGELNNKLSQDISIIQIGIGEKVGVVIQYLTTFVVGYIIGFFKGWQMAAVLVAMSPCMIGAGILFGYVAGKMTAREQEAYNKAGSVAEEVISSIRTVLAFGGEEKERKRYDRNLGDAQKYGRLKGMANGLAVGFYSLVIFSTYAIGMWYGGKLIRHGHMEVGDVIMVFFSISQGTFALGIAAPGMQAISEARGIACSVFKHIDMRSKINSQSEGGKRPTSVIGNIRFRDVHFSYPSRPEVQILKGLNIEARPGQTVALVGASGCGKSTVVQLLLRFYDPKEGHIEVDGIDVKHLNVKWLRRQIGLVSQEPVLFATTIAENIRYGQEHVTMDQIIQAARHANAYDFISKLPDQFNTMVGERGAQLSGGQKQRIAIARALVSDPQILILDEATSALDNESEAIVQDALDKAGQGRTTIVIAHRLSTIRTADIIIGFEDGVVKEKGTHDQLMARRGIYYTLVMDQTKEDEESNPFDERQWTNKKVIAQIDEMRSEKIRHHKGDDGDEDESEMDEDLPAVSFLGLIRMNSKEWFFLLVGFLASIVHGLSQPAFAFVFSSVLKVFAQEYSEMRDDLRRNSLLFIGIGVGTLLGSFIQGWMFSIAGEALTRRLRSQTFTAILRQEIAWFDKPCNSTGALTTRLAKDASLVQGATGTRLGFMTHTIVTILTAVALAAFYGWKLTLVATMFFPFSILGGIVQMKVMSGGMSMAKETIENAGKVAVEALENVRTVTSLTKEDEFIKSYMFHFNSLLKDLWKRAITLGLMYGVSTSMIYYSSAIVFGYGAHLSENDELSPEEGLRVFCFIIFCGIYLGQTAAFGPDVGKATAAARRISYILQRRSEIDADLLVGVIPGKSAFQSKVEFYNATFSYPRRPDVSVLHNMNFKVEPGQTVALVGRSGCGKSTCVSLMERFYTVDKGSVIVGSYRLKDLNIRWLRSQIGLVSQEPVLFDCSIAENIAYGDNTRQVSMDEIIQAAKKANIHNFVTALPQGYDTNVGEKGTQLSGGQKQRIAIARALVRDPKILILDEATSALDTESEKIVQEALDKAREGRTCITIAHRLSTIQDADKIVVVNHGEAVEQGTHEQLMELKGSYYRLQNAQSNG